MGKGGGGVYVWGLMGLGDYDRKSTCVLVRDSRVFFFYVIFMTQVNMWNMAEKTPQYLLS